MIRSRFLPLWIFLLAIPSLTYKIITIDNEEVGKARLPLSALKFE